MLLYLWLVFLLAQGAVIATLVTIPFSISTKLSKIDWRSAPVALKCRTMQNYLWITRPSLVRVRWIKTISWAIRLVCPTLYRDTSPLEDYFSGEAHYIFMTINNHLRPVAEMPLYIN